MSLYYVMFNSSGLIAFGIVGVIVGVIVYLVAYLFAQGGTVFAVSELYLGRTTTIRMAEQILQRVKPKLTLPADNSLSTEKVLENLAYERRATGGYS